MNAGDLKHRITIQKMVISTNENGFEVAVPQEIATVWARKSNLSGRNYWAAAALQREKTVEFGIRYAPFVEDIDTRTYRIIHDNRTYAIVDVDNERYRNVFVILRAEELF